MGLEGLRNKPRGVLAVAQGAWWSPDQDGTDVRGNINTLTTLRPTPLAKGNPQHSNLAAIQVVSATVSP
jgi:anaerobic dimethyl sulfoxide reductase subunit A